VREKDKKNAFSDPTIKVEVLYTQNQWQISACDTLNIGHFNCIVINNQTCHYLCRSWWEFGSILHVQQPYRSTNWPFGLMDACKHFSDRTGNNQICQFMRFMVGVHKHLRHATTICVNKSSFWFNGCCKHFGDRTVNNQTCQFKLYLKKLHEIYWVNMREEKTNIGSGVVLVPQCLFYIRL